MAHSYFDPFSGFEQHQNAISSLLHGQGEIMADDQDLFQCGKCKKQFSLLSDFVAHKQTHVAAKSYSQQNMATPSPYVVQAPTSASPPSYEVAGQSSSSGCKLSDAITDIKALACGGISQSPTSAVQSSSVQSYIVSDDFLSLATLDQPLPGGLITHQQMIHTLNPNLSGLSISFHDSNNPILPQTTGGENEVLLQNNEIIVTSTSSPTGFNHPVFSQSSNSAFSVPNSVIQLQSFEGELMTGSGAGSMSIEAEVSEEPLPGNSHILDTVTVDLSQQPIQTLQLLESGADPTQVVSQILQLPQYSLSLDGQVLINQEPPVPQNQGTSVLKPIAARPASVKKDGYAILQTSPELQALSSAASTAGSQKSGRKVTKTSLPNITPQTSRAAEAACLPKLAAPEAANIKNESKDEADDKPIPEKKKLHCQYCDKIFIKNFDLQQHIRSHTGEKPFQCIVCGRAFAQKSNVKKHMQTHKVWPRGSRTLPSEPIVIIEGNNAVTTTKTSQNVQPGSSVQVMVNNSYQCQYCNQMFTTYFKLKSHMKDHKNEQMYKCVHDKCGAVFKQLEQYLIHIKTHEQEQQFTCHMCSKTFNSLIELGLHQYSHSLYPNQGPKAVFREYKCTLCYTKYASAAALRHHMETSNHHFSCTECGKKFTCERFLRRHLTIHSSLTNHECTECGKKFKTEHYLKMHMSIHSSELSFKCDVCPAAFNRKDKLKRHKSIHDPHKKYRCPFQMHTGCEKSFSRSDKLKAHILSHSSIKPFKCLQCGKEFSRRPHLAEHTKKHRGEYRFKCGICNKGFLRRNLFRNHRCRNKDLKREKEVEEATEEAVVKKKEPQNTTPSMTRTRRPIHKPKKFIEDIDEIPVKLHSKWGTPRRSVGRPRKRHMSSGNHEGDEAYQQADESQPQEAIAEQTEQLELSEEDTACHDESLEISISPYEPEAEQEEVKLEEQGAEEEAHTEQTTMVNSSPNLRLVETEEGVTYLYDINTQQFLVQVTAASDGLTDNPQQTSTPGLNSGDTVVMTTDSENNWFMSSVEGLAQAQTDNNPHKDVHVNVSQEQLILQDGNHHTNALILHEETETYSGYT